MIGDLPPTARPTWMQIASAYSSTDDAVATIVDGDATAACDADEWLIVEAWDES